MKSVITEKAIFSKPMTAIILAGGKSQRMSENKALLPVSGQPLIAKLGKTLEILFQEIIISAQSTELFTFLPYPVVLDLEPDQGPLMGILSGLKASTNPVNFVIACDIPEIDFSFLKQMASFVSDYEIVVPVTGKEKYEPLFAFYNKGVVHRIESLLKREIRKIIELYPLSTVKTIPLNDSTWFYNLNNREDYIRYLENKPANPYPSAIKTKPRTNN